MDGAETQAFIARPDGRIAWENTNEKEDETNVLLLPVIGEWRSWPPVKGTLLAH